MYVGCLIAVHWESFHISKPPEEVHLKHLLMSPILAHNIYFAWKMLKLS